jgi:hypothetical protein
VSGPDTISKLDRLRLRDGQRCWLCDENLDFKAVPNTALAPTFEHLLSQCHDGPDRIENLVLCHRKCNQVLRDRSVAEKVKLRDRRRRKAWAASIRQRILKVLGS